MPKVDGDKEVMVLKPDFQFMLRKKFPKYAGYYENFLTCLILKIRYSKLLRILKSKFFNEVQGENGS